VSTREKLMDKAGIALDKNVFDQTLAVGEVLILEMGVNFEGHIFPTRTTFLIVEHSKTSSILISSTVPDKTFNFDPNKLWDYFRLMR